MATTRCTSCGSPLRDTDEDCITCPYCGTLQERGRDAGIKTTDILRKGAPSGLKLKMLMGLVTFIFIVIASGAFLYFRRYSNEAANMSILQVIKRPAATCGIMHGDEGLIPGHKHQSCDTRFVLHLQNDGNLVLSMGDSVLWATNTAGKDTAMAIMQRDGNFVLYDRQGNPLWGLTHWILPAHTSPYKTMEIW